LNSPGGKSVKIKGVIFGLGSSTKKKKKKKGKKGGKYLYWGGGGKVKPLVG